MNSHVQCKQSNCRKKIHTLKFEVQINDFYYKKNSFRKRSQCLENTVYYTAVYKHYLYTYKHLRVKPIASKIIILAVKL